MERPRQLRKTLEYWLKHLPSEIDKYRRDNDITDSEFEEAEQKLDGDIHWLAKYLATRCKEGTHFDHTLALTDVRDLAGSNSGYDTMSPLEHDRWVKQCLNLLAAGVYEASHQGNFADLVPIAQDQLTRVTLKHVLGI